MAKKKNMDVKSNPAPESASEEVTWLGQLGAVLGLVSIVLGVSNSLLLCYITAVVGAYFSQKQRKTHKTTASTVGMTASGLGVVIGTLIWFAVFATIPTQIVNGTTTSIAPISTTITAASTTIASTTTMPVEETANTTISSFNCTFKYSESGSNYVDYHYEIRGSGTATGPAGAELALLMNPGYSPFPSSSCPQCSHSCGAWGPSELQTCARNGGPATTSWSLYIPASDVTQDYLINGDEVDLQAIIFLNGGEIAVSDATAICH